VPVAVTAVPRGPDGGLRRELRTHLPLWQWTHIESPTTAPGCPDTEFCAPGGAQGWIECKRTAAWALSFQPLQPGWIDRRARVGGRVYVATRRLRPDCDELWLHAGADVLLLVRGGLRAAPALGVWGGGPAGWAWGEVAAALTRC
jgi:hypothetical protein